VADEEAKRRGTGHRQYPDERLYGTLGLFTRMRRSQARAAIAKTTMIPPLTFVEMTVRLYHFEPATRDVTVRPWTAGGVGDAVISLRAYAQLSSFAPRLRIRASYPRDF